MKGARVQKDKRLKIIDDYRKEGVEKFKYIAANEHFVFGLALYLGEGAKAERSTRFFNANPEIIKFMMHWFTRFYKIERSEFTFSILINKIHESREKKVKKYWIRYLGVNETQFRKTIFVKSKHKKVYDNHNSYYGTLRLNVLKSTHLFYRIQGLMYGFLSNALGKTTRRRSSVVRAESS